MAHRTLCFEAPDRAALELAARGPLPPPLEESGEPRREAFRDVFLDTGDDDLRQRGAAAWVRLHEDGARTLHVSAPAADGARRMARTVLSPVSPAPAASAGARPASPHDDALSWARPGASGDPASGLDHGAEDDGDGPAGGAGADGSRPETSGGRRAGDAVPAAENGGGAAPRNGEADGDAGDAASQPSAGDAAGRGASASEAEAVPSAATATGGDAGWAMRWLGRAMADLAGSETGAAPAAGAGDDAGMAAGDGSVPAGPPSATALLRAMVDPARLRPVLEVTTDRTLRFARLAHRPEVSLRVAADAVTVRAEGEVARGSEVMVRVDGRRKHAAPALAALVEALGLAPAPEDRLARARGRLARAEVGALAAAVRVSHRAAVVAMHDGRLGLLREGGLLCLPTAPGHGETAAREAVRTVFGDVAVRMRMLGIAPGSATRPATEVWLAEGIDPLAGETTVSWTPLPEVLAAVDGPALRDPTTLAALNVLARTPLVDGAPPAGDAGLPAPLPAPDDGTRGAGDPPAAGTLLNMELSHLAFNRRVLALAEDEATPLLERVRFVSIFAANLDEFFRVRVAGFQRQVAAGSTKRTMDGVTAHEQLDALGIRARTLTARAYDAVHGHLLPALEARGVRVVRGGALDAEGRRHVREHFRAEVLPLLTPVAAGPGHPFPHVRNLRPALAAVVRDPVAGTEHLVILELPGGVPRFVPLPGGTELVPLEDVVRDGLGEMYPGWEVGPAHCFRVTRSAELSLSGRPVHDLLHAVEEEVRRRPFRPVVRLEVEREMAEEMRALLLRELQAERPARAGTLSDADVYPVPWPVDLVAVRELAAAPVEGEGLRWPAVAPRVPVPADRPLMDLLREREVLVHFPFDSFEATVERFVIEAADDPDVVAVKLALYRTNRSSRVVEALRRAAARGKQVVALVELTARFDEQSNIEWARYLRAAGIHVIYGLPGLKVHAKVALVVRREADGPRRYAYVGTGNLNASTAALYTDLGLLTADPAVGEDLNALFNALTGYAPPPRHHVLLVSPHAMRTRFVEMIGREAEHARAGRGGHIRAKVNGLADREIIAALYRASAAGVRVELVVRGMCALRPGVAGLSENVRVYSALGRYLEHARIFRFADGGDPQYYIGSADWRTRNLSRRVEVAVPVRDPTHRARLDEILDAQLARPDLWELGADGTYYRRPAVPPHAAERPAGRDGRRAFVTHDGV
jgi:polyphosphate kinase